MRKQICIGLFLLCYWCGWHTVLPAPAAAAAKTSNIAVVLLGSLEYQQRDYYEIAAETLRKRFDEPKYKVIVGAHPQHVFNRYCDKQGLAPGAIPPEEKRLDSPIRRRRAGGTATGRLDRLL